MLHFPGCPHPFPVLTASLLVEGHPQACTGKTGLCAEAGCTGLSHLTVPSWPISLSLQFAHTRYSAPLRKEGGPGPTWQRPLRTIKTLISFDLIILLLGTASREIIQKKKKDACPVHSSAIYNREKVEANAMSQTRKMIKLQYICIRE